MECIAPNQACQWTLPRKLEAAKWTHQERNEDCVSQQQTVEFEITFVVQR